MLAGVSFLFNSKRQSICQEAEQCSAPRVRLLSNLSTLASFPKKNHQKADTEMELFEVVLLLCSALLWNILRQILSYWKLLYQRPTVKFSCYGFMGWFFYLFLESFMKIYVREVVFVWDLEKPKQFLFKCRNLNSGICVSLMQIYLLFWPWT